MVRTADSPSHRRHFHSQPLDHHSIDAPRGYLASWFADPDERSGGCGGGLQLHRPPYRASPFRLRGCYGAYGSRHLSDGHPPDHGVGCGGPVGLLVSNSPPPPDRGAAGHSPIKRSQRGPGVSPVPSPSTRSPQRERRHREYHHHHRARDESSRSPRRLHLPLRGSKSVPSSRPYRLEDGRKGSKSLPSSKRYRLDAGRKAFSSTAHWYDDDDERGGSRGRYGDGGDTQELTCPSSYEHGHNLSLSKSNFSQCYDGERSFSAQRHSSSRKPPLPIEMSPWDDGYKSPSSPTYCCEDELDVGRGMRYDDRAENFASDCPGACDGLEIAAREPNFKYEDPVHKKKMEDFDALVDDFMDAVLKNWRKLVSPDLTVDKEAYRKQTNRFAELALKRYNKDKNNKVKYSLVEALGGAAIFEDSILYAHVNFYANAKNGPKKNGPKELVFAELKQVGQRPNAMVLTSFHLLDDEKQFPGSRDQARSCQTTEGKDVYHCYACSDKIKHPEGLLYKAGHFTDTLCYLND